MPTSSPAPGQPPLRRPAWRRALNGAAEGFIYVGLGVLLAGLVFGAGRVGLYPAGVVYALLGALLFAVGRVVADGVMGAVAGGLLGAVLGSQAAPWVPLDLPLPSARVGAPATLEIRGPGLDGQPVDLMDHRGQVVLIDFWATWCPPCVEEIPNVKKAYERFHADGFEVIGVSLDRRRSDLTRFVEKNQLSWRQIYFDDAGQGGNPLAVRYQIDSIPATFLVGRDGAVIARDLRGPELEAAVALAVQGREAEAGDRTFPVGFLLTLGAGALAGALGGALIERRLARPGPAGGAA